MEITITEISSALLIASLSWQTNSVILHKDTHTQEKEGRHLTWNKISIHSRGAITVLAFSKSTSRKFFCKEWHSIQLGLSGSFATKLPRQKELSVFSRLSIYSFRLNWTWRSIIFLKVHMFCRWNSYCPPCCFALHGLCTGLYIIFLEFRKGPILDLIAG